MIPLSMAAFLAITPISALASNDHHSKQTHKNLKVEMKKVEINSSSKQLKVNSKALAYEKTSGTKAIVVTTTTQDGKELVEEVKDKVDEVVEKVEDKVNDEIKTEVDADLMIDSSVTSFGTFTTSESLAHASGSIKLQGDVKKEDKKLHPVYKFNLENDESTTLTGLTATIQFPDGYVLDERFPQLVLITPTNKNPLMDDVKYTLTEAKDGMTLTIPDLLVEEKLHFDVKFFLVKKEEVEPVLTDEIKAKVSLVGTADLKLKNKKVELTPTIRIENQSDVGLKSCSLHFKIPVNFKVEDIIWLNGFKAAFDVEKDGSIVVRIPELPQGKSDLSFKVAGSFEGEFDGVALPLTLAMGEELITLQPMKVVVSSSGTDSDEDAEEDVTGTSGDSSQTPPNATGGTSTGSVSGSEVGGVSETNSMTQVAGAYDSEMLPKTGSLFSNNILMILGAIAMGIGGFFYRRGQWNGQ